MQVDVIGLENVISYIQATKLSKFVIQRAGSNAQAIPIFECIDSDSNANAINEFTKWASVMNNATPYKITLFDFAEIITDASGQTKVQKSKNKSGKTEILFVINAAGQVNQANQSTITPSMGNGGFDLQSLRADIINEISKKQEESAILTEIKALKQRFAELDAEEEEEEEEEETNAMGGVDASQLGQIMTLVNMLKGQSKPATINGIDEQRDNINKAIKILYKHDKSLDTDLLKLAEIAETKPDMFKTLISTLRSM